jgi:DnaJ domain
MTTISDNKNPSSSSKSPTEAMMIMLAPDGYYAYLQIPKPLSLPGDNNNNNNNSRSSSQDMLDLIKKNYRKLSIKHHPDKPGGDVETFRLLKRAQTVLSSPKLRHQYDILGLDLDDDEEDNEHPYHYPGDDHDNNSNNNYSSSSSSSSKYNNDGSSSQQGIVHEIATMALTVILQTCVRTGE